MRQFRSDFLGVNMNALIAGSIKLTLCLCMVIITVAYAMGMVSTDDFKLILGAGVAVHMGTSAISGFAKKENGP